MTHPHIKVPQRTVDTAPVRVDIVDTWEAAERLAAAAMRAWGYTDARVTNRGADGGIDVRSRQAVAQVKFVTAKTGRPDIQKLVGASRPDVQRFFFSRSGYSKTAVTFAVSAGVALFAYDELGRVQAWNGHAQRVLELARRHQPATAFPPPAAPSVVGHPQWRPAPRPAHAPVHRPYPPQGPTVTLPRPPRPSRPVRVGPSRARVNAGNKATAVLRWVIHWWAELLLAWVWLVVASGVNRLVQVGPDKLIQLTVWTVAAAAGTVVVARRVRRRRAQRRTVPVSQRDDVVNCPPTGTPRG